jgi:energy-coupling factor transporter transmembrane protein EcfT
MDARGYGVSRKRSRYRPISWRLNDSAIVFTATLIFVVVLVMAQ